MTEERPVATNDNLDLPGGVTVQDLKDFEAAIDKVIEVAHKLNARWWIDPKTGADLRDNPLIVPVKLLMTISEVCEAMEGDRCDLMDDKIPEFSAMSAEMADAFIRLGDLAGAKKINVGAAAYAKCIYNATRPDHKAENRVKKNGKKY
jgi:hypothetical protein